MVPRGIPFEQGVGDPPRALLLRHHECPALEVRLVKLHDFLKNDGLFRQVSAEAAVPAAHRFLREGGERRRLLHGHRGAPRPEEEPELLER